MHAPPSSQRSCIHLQVSFIIFQGLGSGEVMAFGNGPGYKHRDKGYLERSGHDGGGGADNSIMTGEGPPDEEIRE